MEIVYSILQQALERFGEKFPRLRRSLIRRALKRLSFVREVGTNHYAVEGRTELGDKRPAYFVWLEGGRWRCTCRSALWRRGVCTHIVTVMLYREYRLMLEKAERRTVYVAEAEVECPGRVEANGEVYVKPLGGQRYRVLVVSRLRDVKIKCGGYVVYETEGEKTTYAAALALIQRFTKQI
jgi:hypothetical protein